MAVILECELRNFYSKLGDMRSELEKLFERKENLREALRHEYKKQYGADSSEARSFGYGKDFDSDFGTHMWDIDTAIMGMVELLETYESKL